MQALSPKEAQIFELVRRSIDNGVVPSVREICVHLGIKSTSTVHRYLSALEQKGYIQRGQNLNRAIRLPSSAVSRVPLLGVVTAGQPILAVESIEEYIPVSVRGDPKELFALRVRGESMIEAGILDGDLIIARRCESASNGDIVVALIDDEATVKRFFKENGHYRLQPENHTMQPIITDHVTILGCLVALHREF